MLFPFPTLYLVHLLSKTKNFPPSPRSIFRDPNITKTPVFKKVRLNPWTPHGPLTTSNQKLDMFGHSCLITDPFIFNSQSPSSLGRQTSSQDTLAPEYFISTPDQRKFLRILETSLIALLGRMNIEAQYTCIENKMNLIS